MTNTFMPAIVEEPAGAAAAAAAAAAGETVARAADEREKIERELAADPWNLVRRACQVADYEFGAAPSPETEGR